MYSNQGQIPSCVRHSVIKALFMDSLSNADVLTIPDNMFSRLNDARPDLPDLTHPMDWDKECFEISDWSGI